VLSEVRGVYTPPRGGLYNILICAMLSDAKVIRGRVTRSGYSVTGA